MVTNLNLSHVAVREADLDLSLTSGLKYWFLPGTACSQIDSGVVLMAPRATATAPHIHPDDAEYFSVEYGELDVFLSDHWTRLTAGQSLTVPRGVLHTVRNSGQSSCLYYYSIGVQA